MGKNRDAIKAINLLHEKNKRLQRQIQKLQKQLKNFRTQVNNSYDSVEELKEMEFLLKQRIDSKTTIIGEEEVKLCVCGKPLHILTVCGRVLEQCSSCGYRKKIGEVSDVTKHEKS